MVNLEHTTKVRHQDRLSESEIEHYVAVARTTLGCYVEVHREHLRRIRLGLSRFLRSIRRWTDFFPSTLKGLWRNFLKLMLLRLYSRLSQRLQAHISSYFLLPARVG